MPTEAPRRGEKEEDENEEDEDDDEEEEEKYSSSGLEPRRWMGVAGQHHSSAS